MWSTSRNHTNLTFVQVQISDDVAFEWLFFGPSLSKTAVTMIVDSRPMGRGPRAGGPAQVILEPPEPSRIDLRRVSSPSPEAGP